MFNTKYVWLRHVYTTCHGIKDAIKRIYQPIVAQAPLWVVHNISKTKTQCIKSPQQYSINEVLITQNGSKTKFLSRYYHICPVILIVLL